MPDITLSQALKEAYASANPKDIIYHTIEIRHDTFTQPLRVVLGNRPFYGKLEDSAPENPGEVVYFAPYSFDFTKPEVGPNGIPQMEIVIDNVSREISSALEGAVASMELVEITYREFFSEWVYDAAEYMDDDYYQEDYYVSGIDSLSNGELQNDPPLTMYITDVTSTIFNVRGVCRFPDLANKKFPTVAYEAETFRGLVRDR